MSEEIMEVSFLGKVKKFKMSFFLACSWFIKTGSLHLILDDHSNEVASPHMNIFRTVPGSSPCCNSRKSKVSISALGFKH